MTSESLTSLLGALRQKFAYNTWANREALAAVEAAGSSPDQALSVMAHIIGAERLWLGRLTSQADPALVWPTLNVAECLEQLHQLERDWNAYIQSLNSQRLAEAIDYTNTKGEPWTSAIADVLMHVILHSAYHRGQAALLLRQAGHEPAYTDFIHCIRQGHLQSQR